MSIGLELLDWFGSYSSFEAYPQIHPVQLILLLSNNAKARNNEILH